MIAVNGCDVCREVAGEVELPGGFVWEPESVVAFHVPPLLARAAARPTSWSYHVVTQAPGAERLYSAVIEPCGGLTPDHAGRWAAIRGSSVSATLPDRYRRTCRH